MAKPVADSVKALTPRIDIPNCPDPGLYIPVVVSVAKYNEGAGAEPSTRLNAARPAKIVFAFTKFAESQMSVDCVFALNAATIAPETPVDKVTV